MKRSAFLIAAAVLVLAAAAWYFLFSGDPDEKIIQENLAQLVELAEKQQGESVFVTLGDSRAIMQYISLQPRIDFGSRLPEITDRDELEGLIIQARQTIHSLNLRVANTELVVAPDGKTAQMEIEVVGTGTYFDNSGQDKRSFSIEWVKEEGEWLVGSVRHHGNFVPADW